MITPVKETIKNVGMCNSFNRYRGRTLEHAYNNPSVFKKNAFRDICYEMHSLHGYDLTVTGASSFTFSCSYLYKQDGKLYLVYHTHVNRFVIEVNEF